MASLYEEQIDAEDAALRHLTEHGSDSQPEAASYFPAAGRLRQRRAAAISRRCGARARRVDIPVIASLNGIDREGWIEYAARSKQAGAAAIELNIYFIPADLDDERRRRWSSATSRSSGRCGRRCRIPVAVKLGPYFSSIGNMARALVEAGADGLVLFNRFYQPDIDLAHAARCCRSRAQPADEIRLPLLWIALLAGRVKASLAATTGVETADEVVKYLLVGADVVMTTSALLRHGVDHMAVLLAGLTYWLGAREFPSLNSPLTKSARLIPSEDRDSDGGCAMAMRREAEVQGDLVVTWAEMPRSPGHAFYDRLQKLLSEAGFDAFVEDDLQAVLRAADGRSVAAAGPLFPDAHDRLFRGDRQRARHRLALFGFAVRCGISCGLANRDKVPDHSWLSKTRSRLPHEVHEKVFGWVLALVAERGLVKGERIGVDGSTMEANAALRTIVRRENGETYRQMLTRMAQESGVATPTIDDLVRLDRKPARARSCRTRTGRARPIRMRRSPG